MILFSILILSILYLVPGIKWYQAWYEGAFKTSNAIREVSRYQYFEQSNFLTLGPSSKLTWQPLWPQSLPCTCWPTPLPPFPAWSSCIDCIDILYYRVRITVGHRRIYGEFLHCARSKENPQICFIWCFLMKRMRTLPGTAQVAPASQPSRSLSEKSSSILLSEPGRFINFNWLTPILQRDECLLIQFSDWLLLVGQWTYILLVTISMHRMTHDPQSSKW